MSVLDRMGVKASDLVFGSVTFLKYSEDEARDDHGRWTAGGSDFTSQSVPKEQSQALHDYIGAGYITTNAYLRDPTFKADLIQEAHDQGKPVEAKTGKVETQIAQMDLLMAQAPPLAGDLTTYRGVDGGQFAKELQGLQPGDTFTDKGFVSTDISQETARYFSTRGFGRGMVMEVTNPAGTRGINVDAFTNAGHIGESEFLLPRDSTFTVTSVQTGRISVRTGR